MLLASVTEVFHRLGIAMKLIWFLVLPSFDFQVSRECPSFWNRVVVEGENGGQDFTVVNTFASSEFTDILRLGGQGIA